MTIDLAAAARRATSLAGLTGGVVHLPGEPAYEAARLPWNVAVDQRPAAVAVPRHVADVELVVRAAAAEGLRVAPQSTGHNAGPLAAQGLHDVVLLRMQELRGVTVDPARRTVRVEGGARWADAVEPAADHGLAALHGSSPGVGIAGYTLGGGIGWYARRLGLASNSLTAVELVTADGDFVRATESDNRELFWALRGGGGSFGVVTALELRLFPIEAAYAGMLVWDRRHAERVLRRWAEWGREAPESVSTSFRFLDLPSLSGIPAPLRGRSLVVVDGAALACDSEAQATLAPLRALGPEIDTFDRIPARALPRIHLDPEGPTPSVSGSAMLDRLDDGTVDALLSQVGPGSTSSLLWTELRQLGGALARPAASGGVLSHLDAETALFAVAVAATPEPAARGRADARRLTEAVRPWTARQTYLNFAEEPVDVSTAFDESAWLQLKGIRSAYDPEDRFAANHRIPRLFEDGRVTA
jgi:FAD/FMN-containing dehydrogenase